MATVTTTFLLTDEIKKNLVAGTYERIGGVVREVKTKRVVAWLRESSFRPTKSISNLVPNILNLEKSLLNLGFSSMGFIWILQRLDSIEQNLQDIQQSIAEVNQKIDLGFYANFRAALDLARNAFTMSQADNRKDSAMQAINRFLEVEHYYIGYIDNLVQKENEAAATYLPLLFLSFVAEARCYLEIKEVEVASRRLKEGAKTLKRLSEKCINLLLTSNPAIYLHPVLSEKVNLSRLTKVYQWFDPSLNENLVFESQRKNFFKLAQQLPRDQTELTFHAAKSFFKNFNLQKTGQEMLAQFEIYDRLPQMMEQMEAVIETYRRFESYQSEIEAIAQLGMSFHEWLQLKPSETQPEGAELMYIMLSEPLELISVS
jgi:hypothetical protein